MIKWTETHFTLSSSDFVASLGFETFAADTSVASLCVKTVANTRQARAGSVVRAAARSLPRGLPGWSGALERCSALGQRLAHQWVP